MQVVVIHGGTSFASYNNYLDFLASTEISRARLQARRDWKDMLQEELGEGFEVLSPRMPNSTNARYTEWKLWFERVADVIDDPVVLIGHSLGGLFLAKYLSENVFPKKIAAVVLVAAPYSDGTVMEHGESLDDFLLPASLAPFAEYGGKIVLMHSSDDPVVPLGDLAKYRAAVPACRVIEFSDRQHFNQDSFPELVDLLRSLK